MLRQLLANLAFQTIMTTIPLTLMAASVGKTVMVRETPRYTRN